MIVRLTRAGSAGIVNPFNGRTRRLHRPAVMKTLILGSALLGVALFAAPAQAARIVFSAATGSPINAPAVGGASERINGFVPIAITSATGGFVGATGWLNTNNVADRQPFAYNIPNLAAPGSTRSVDYRFNSFTLQGSCALCGLFNVDSASTVGFPATGILNNAGTAQAQIRGGALYGQPAISFNLPGLTQPGSVSFEANSNGLYTITIDTIDEVPAPLPILGAASMFAYSRRLRQRIRLSKAA